MAPPSLYPPPHRDPLDFSFGQQVDSENQFFEAKVKDEDGIPTQCAGCLPVAACFTTWPSHSLGINFGKIQTLSSSQCLCWLFDIFCAVLSLKLDLVRFSLEADFPRRGLSVLFGSKDRVLSFCLTFTVRRWRPLSKRRIFCLRWGRRPGLFDWHRAYPVDQQTL